MFDDLEHYLTTLMSRERIDLVLSILNKLTMLVGPEHTTTFGQYSLGVPQDVDPMEEVARFDDALLDLVTASFGELGITLDDDATDTGCFRDVDAILFAIEHVAQWDDAERLLGIMTSSDDREMAIAEVVAEINNSESTPYALLMSSVSGPFYSNLLELIQSNAEADAVNVASTIGGPMTRIKAHFKGRGSSFVSDLIRDNTLTFGLEYAFYLKFYENAIWDLDLNDLTQALLDFAACSDLADTEVCPSAFGAIGNYVESIEQGTQFTVAMQAAINKMPSVYGGGAEAQ